MMNGEKPADLDAESGKRQYALVYISSYIKQNPS
jgi:hypothetical protein